MLRISVAVSVGVHVVLLCVASVVVAHNARRTPETKTFEVSVRHASVAQLQPNVNPPETFRQPTAPLLPNPTPPPILHARKIEPQIRPQPRPTLPKPDYTPPPSQRQATRPQAPERRIPVPPEQAVTIANAFPTPLPTPTALPTPRPTVTPPPAPPPTPLPTATPQPVETAAPPQPTAPPLLTPALPASPTAVADAQAEEEPEPATPQPTQAGNVAASSASDREDVPRAAHDEMAQAEKEAVVKAYAQEIVALLQKTKRYPRTARRKGWEGAVAVTLHLLPSGELERVELARTSGYESLDDAALQAVQQAQPFPAFPPVLSAPALRITIPVQFRLE